MKKITILISLLLCLGLLAGCGVQAALHDVAEQLHNANAETEAADDSPSDSGGILSESEEAPAFDAAPEEYSSASAADAGDDIVAAPAEETLSPETPAENTQTDFTALSLAECVTDADGAGGQLPRIVLDCPGASSINEDIEGTFRYLVDADYCTLYYDASKNGSVLSVMVAQLYDGDSSYYTPYLLDLSTGQRMNGYDLLDKMGLSAADVSAAELRIMGQEFEYQYGAESLGENADFYQEQFQRTVYEDNADLNRLWLSTQGELSFVAKIYSMAGAEFYEYPMGTGYYYG